MSNKTSQHILGTSASLLGFCLVVITSIQLTDKTATTRIDELTGFVSLLLIISSLFSFISIRTDDKVREDWLEGVADYFFLMSLLGILGIIIFVFI